ncbi:unnamed protein product [Prorocentrum cordatum]|uniref:Uncharacterized protein n=1 Tax=Prorocentrum cordatum TaxID=2364126 RepID=A0ABN9UYF1_9DINO|nr:unnamed protein product [Polarella glacialis]
MAPRLPAAAIAALRVSARRPPPALPAAIFAPRRGDGDASPSGGAASTPGSGGAEGGASGRAGARDGASSVVRPEPGRVWFNSPMNSAVDITPYSKVYGQHPRSFHFDGDGAMEDAAAPSGSPKETSVGDEPMAQADAKNDAKRDAWKGAKRALGLFRR